VRVIQTVHPDHLGINAPKEQIIVAQTVFHELTVWRDRAEEKIKKGLYGDSKPHVPAPAPSGTGVVQVIQTPKRKYIVTDLIAHGDLADLYRCAFTEGSDERHAVFKIARSAADNDLADAESKTLLAMYPAAQTPERFYRYLPKPIDSFLLKGEKGMGNRRVNVMELADGYVSLAEIIHAYPKGIDYRDAVWMFKRALAALWYVHRQKLVVHGAILPPHILVHPTGHGAKIVDWSYAVQGWEDSKGRVKAISKDYRTWYAPEVLSKGPPLPQTDLFMLGRCMIALLGGDVGTGQMPDAVPKEIRAFIMSLLVMNPARRPDDASKLHEEFDELLQRIVGKPKYRPLVMPAAHRSAS
jgi:serine/threonine protein kinase